MLKTNARTSTIDSVSIERLIDTFYTYVRADELLGRIFAQRIGDEWSVHLKTMNLFWRSILLKTREYRGTPATIHRAIPQLTEAHFDRWLELFERTVNEQFERKAQTKLLTTVRGIRGALGRAVIGPPAT